MTEPRTVVWPTMNFLGWVPDDWLWPVILSCMAFAWFIAWRLGKRDADRFRVASRPVYERLCVDCMWTTFSEPTCGQGRCTRCGEYGWLTAVKHEAWTL